MVTAAIVAVTFSLIMPQLDAADEAAAFKAPSKLVANGPYGRNVIITNQIGDCTVQLKAGRLFVENGQTAGFQNALLRQMVAENLEVEIYDGRVLMFRVESPREKLSGFSQIKIKHPRISFPANMQADRVNIDNHQVTLISSGQVQARLVF